MVMTMALGVLLVVATHGLRVPRSTQATRLQNMKGNRFDASIYSSVNSPDAWDMKLRSPCKLNLFLRILGRRENGFHDLASLFQAISLSDTLYVTKINANDDGDGQIHDELTCSDTTLEIDDSNLVSKALNLMREKTGIQAHFKVYLEKNVPMQAGLGGGSGNAATAMYAFNALCGYPASNDDMKLWSGDIGSDITFFFSTGTAYCTGRGEVIDALPPLPGRGQVRVHVFKPDEGLSTGKVFSCLDLEACRRQMEPETLLQLWTDSIATEAAAKGGLVNDLESPAFECSPSLQSLRDTIAACPPFRGAVMMSGSGTSIYALTRRDNDEDEENIRRAVRRVQAAHPSVRYFDCSFLEKEDQASAWYEQ
jgi:4-diphosphocytidyl-2-C-methyl-D-erythritol kinase